MPGTARASQGHRAHGPPSGKGQVRPLVCTLEGEAAGRSLSVTPLGASALMLCPDAREKELEGFPRPRPSASGSSMRRAPA